VHCVYLYLYLADTSHSYFYKLLAFASPDVRLSGCGPGADNVDLASPMVNVYHTRISNTEECSHYFKVNLQSLVDKIRVYCMVYPPPEKNVRYVTSSCSIWTYILVHMKYNIPRYLPHVGKHLHKSARHN